MTFHEFQKLIRMDLFRYEGGTGLFHLCHMYFFEPGFRLTFQMRLCAYTRSQWWSRIGIYHFCRFLYHLNSVRYGVYIDFTTKIGGGLCIGHPCSIIVNRRCVIGRHCNLAHNITLGVSNRGDRQGCPVIEDTVYIGTGSVIYGKVTIGSNSAVGANAVVNKDVLPGTVVAGAPAKTVSQKGSSDYNRNFLDL